MRELFANGLNPSLLNRISPKYKPVWESMSVKDQQALALYFLPHRSAKPVLGPTRPRILKWYCPFACQKVFASGHRYCLNVYTGCDHQCVYCYAAGYEPENANPKKNFEKLLCKDLDDLETFDVPPAPVHLSNSTDPFQPIEERFGHTKFALEQILKHRKRFTTVTLLAKNPLPAGPVGLSGPFQRIGRCPVKLKRPSRLGRRSQPRLPAGIRKKSLRPPPPRPSSSECRESAACTRRVFPWSCVSTRCSRVRQLHNRKT